MSSTAIVVGGGVIGASCAYYLSAQDIQVQLFDVGDIGGGTSSRCDGNILAIDKDPGFDSQLALGSQKLLRDLVQVVGPMEYRQPGSYLVCDNGDEVLPAQRWVETQKDQGLPFSYLDYAAVHEALPHLAEDIPGGLYCASDATLNPLLYTHRLIEAARGQGARIYPRHGVEEILTDGGHVKGVRLQTGDDVRADIVVVASGVWTPKLLEPIGISIPIMPRKGHLLVSARGPLFGHAKVMEFGYLMSKFGQERMAPPAMVKHGIALVYEPTMSHNFLLGSSREFVGEDIKPNPTISRLIAERALRFYPGMSHATLMRTYAGLRPYTPDHFPVISRVDAVRGLLIAAGHEGDGIGLAAITGALVRDLVLDREPAYDLKPLRWDRFHKEGEPHTNAVSARRSSDSLPL